MSFRGSREILPKRIFDPSSTREDFSESWSLEVCMMVEYEQIERLVDFVCAKFAQVVEVSCVQEMNAVVWYRNQDVSDRFFGIRITISVCPLQVSEIQHLESFVF